MPQLDPSSFASQIFWLVIAFGLLYYFMLRVAIPQVGGVLRARQDRIQKDLELAESLREDAARMKAEYEKSLQATRERAGTLIAEATQEADEASAQRHLELDRVLGEKMKAANQSIQAAEKRAVAVFTPVAAELSQLIVSRLTNIKIKEKDAMDKVNHLMKGLKKDV